MHVKRIAELDILRGVAIFGVLVLHSSFEGRFNKETMAVQAVMERLFDWAVLAFFFSSGFLHDRLMPLTTTLKKRLMSLLVPFFLYNALYNICFAGAEIMGWMPASNVELHAKLLVTCFFRSPGFQLYFLPYLFLVSVGVGCVDKLARSHSGPAYLVLLFMVLAFYLCRGYPEFSYGADYSRIPLYLGAFLVGVTSRPFIETPFARPWTIMGALCVILAILVFFRFRAVSLLVPPLLTGAANAIQTIRQSRLLLCMGGVSGSIYLWHTPVMLPAITRLLAHCGIPSLFNLFGSIGLTLMICFLLRLGLDAFFVKVMKRQTPRYVTL